MFEVDVEYLLAHGCSERFTCDLPAKASMQRRHLTNTVSSLASTQHPYNMSGALGLGGYSSSEDEDETVAPISKSNQVTSRPRQLRAQKVG